jgi:uncharacterized membrane protein YgdD (TMEM256/DUF423 family)
MKRNFLAISGISGAIAVSLGALGTHYLKSKVAEGIITPENHQSYQIAVQYQVYHTLALIAIALLPESKTFKTAGMLFLIGIFLFSGSIYILSLRSLFNIQGLTWLGPVTPLGGLCFITGWILIFTGALQLKNQKNEL